eukprot:CAMPEP_0177609538 /NCGR_PEP_ID=MMETSP0419_2-20121207/19154_1 /TAXON_ID=582737 /ORGANISM="Tetraselmis sp., Strain GSL018" /LENGTH=166 /DNA_ID=CAMNT_0019104493 /DNA_START=94 /DNA_END=592 /DNA_ORIENTATION=+
MSSERHGYCRGWLRKPRWASAELTSAAVRACSPSPWGCQSAPSQDPTATGVQGKWSLPVPMVMQVAGPSCPPPLFLVASRDAPRGMLVGVETALGAQHAPRLAIGPEHNVAAVHVRPTSDHGRAHGLVCEPHALVGLVPGGGSLWLLKPGPPLRARDQILGGRPDR